MNPAELEAARRLLFLSHSEAAELAGVADRTWRRWETGKCRIPQDVADMMAGLLSWRSQAVDSMLSAIGQAVEERGVLPEQVALVWYDRPQDMLEPMDIGMFRADQSALAEVAAETGARLVPFDRADYEAWRAEHGRADSHLLRSEWAARHW